MTRKGSMEARGGCWDCSVLIVVVVTELQASVQYPSVYLRRGESTGPSTYKEINNLPRGYQCDESRGPAHDPNTEQTEMRPITSATT